MTSHQIQWLIDDHNLEGLERALRHPSDPILRAEAAQALGKLDDLKAVEMLIRSSLEDPDLTVQKTARSALDDLIGSEAKQAVATYRSGPPETEPWLLNSLAEPGRSGSAMESQSSAVLSNQTIRRLKSRGDLDGLVGWLRYPVDPKIREEAALALGEIGNLDATEPLIRSHLEDPDPDVRKISRQALDSLVGSQTDLAISAYRSGPAEKDDWLIDRSLHAGEASKNEEEWEEVAGEDLMDYIEEAAESEDDESELEEGLADVPEGEPGDEESLHGLITVLQTSRDPAIRQRAFQMLLRSHNIHAVWYLAQTALYSDDTDLRQAAKAALDERFGDQAPSILEGYKEGNLEGVALDEVDEDEDEEEDEDAEEIESPFEQSPSLKDFTQPQVIREDTLNWRLIFVAGLALLSVAAIILLLTLRG
jgi:HEAT repeat protein